MRLTSKGRYAVRAMLDLTTHSNGNPVRLQEISTRQNISLHYLEQLFRKLRNGQAVKSVRGPGGGYVLARHMDQITIRDILDCVGENINPARDIIGTEAEVANSLEFELSKNYFQNLGVIMREYLTATSLGDLVRRAKDIKLPASTLENNVNAEANSAFSATNSAMDSAMTSATTSANATESWNENSASSANNQTGVASADSSRSAHGLTSSIRNPIGEVNQ